MEETGNVKVLINLSFEEIQIPPFQDILVVGKKSPQGKVGLAHALELIVPNEFILYEVSHPVVEAVFINQRLLKKIEKEKILDILSRNVFPFVSESELLKVDFKLKIVHESIQFERTSG